MGFWQRLITHLFGRPRLADPNAHIREYLDHYLALPDAPNYAVMLTGPWGGGKTHLTKGLMRELQKQGTKHVYVSLYGIRTREEFDRAVLAALYPFITNRAVKASAQLIGALLSTVRVNMKFSAEDYLSKFDADLFVFDDLERCDMPVASALGYINPFVEHGGCKVIVLANEAEIRPAEQDEYKRRKEKVIGQTLALTPDLDSALPTFIDRIADTNVKKFLEANTQSIGLVSQQSGTGNLRILQQAFWDFSRFYATLPADYRTKDSSVDALLAPFMVFAIEFKTGNLNLEKLQGRTLAARVLAASRDNKEPNPFEKTADKYGGVDLTDRLFSDELLIEMFEQGTFTTESARASLERSGLFTDPSETPSWRVVWEKEICADDQVATAIADMEAKFTARAYAERGVVLHVFGLRLRLSDEGLLPFSRAEVVDQCRAYVDDLEKEGLLPPLEDELYHPFSYTAFEGLGFTDGESEEFQKLLKYLLARQGAVLDASYPAKARELLVEMAEDDGLFWRRINYSNTQDTRYADIPIFYYIAPEEFVDALQKLSNYRQRSVLMALQTRYGKGKLTRDLPDERAWIEQVRDILLERAKNSDAIAKIRIERFVEWTIGKVLSDLEAAEKQAAEEQAPNQSPTAG